MTAPPSNRWTVPVIRSPRCVFELVEKTVAFGFADLLDDDLLGGLGGDPPEVGRDDRFAIGQGADLARILIDRDGDFLGVGIMLLGGRGQSRLDPLEQNILGNVLVAVDTVDDSDQIDAHGNLRGGTKRGPMRDGPATTGDTAPVEDRRVPDDVPPRSDLDDSRITPPDGVDGISVEPGPDVRACRNGIRPQVQVYPRVDTTVKQSNNGSEIVVRSLRIVASGAKFERTE